MYSTVVVDRMGVPFFRKDLYNRDPAIRRSSAPTRSSIPASWLPDPPPMVGSSLRSPLRQGTDGTLRGLRTEEKTDRHQGRSCAQVGKRGFEHVYLRVFIAVFWTFLGNVTAHTIKGIYELKCKV